MDTIIKTNESKKRTDATIKNVVLVHGAFVDGSGWRALYEVLGLIATEDKSIAPEIQRKMYKRSNTKVTEIKGSHVIFMSQPEAVAKAIIEASVNSLVASEN